MYGTDQVESGIRRVFGMPQHSRSDLYSLRLGPLLFLVVSPKGKLLNKEATDLKSRRRRWIRLLGTALQDEVSGP